MDLQGKGQIIISLIELLPTTLWSFLQIILGRILSMLGMQPKAFIHCPKNFDRIEGGSFNIDLNGDIYIEIGHIQDHNVDTWHTKTRLFISCGVKS